MMHFQNAAISETLQVAGYQVAGSYLDIESWQSVNLEYWQSLLTFRTRDGS